MNHHSVAKLALVRWLAYVSIYAFNLLGRVWSHIRFYALLPQAGRSTCHWSVEIKYPENIEVGDRVSIGPYSCLGAKSRIVLEDYVRISRGVIIETATLDRKTGLPYKHISKPITIKRGVWLASNVVVLGGVTIGENAVIGAGVVISKDVPDNAVIVGVHPRALSDRVVR